ncbi:hypothetical protein UP10_28510 [Bradyrhizobium sp. LTSPM299]|uniref:hypothetical protein n=1 Tax=Bradyrhizobium sp. LTSPM299 TaxID=1619233 RepID=UPI0005CB42A0|nr:hypothetical protein [Bradyrhizobium sp. LTSPM299]KJC57525.1 hypothetical protein UP10_28510 [Bradyrhizobium sp. LTSPM299]
MNALGAYVGRLSWLYLRLGLWKDWPAVLDRLRSNIQHPSWYKKIAYHRAFYHLSPGGDREKARQELAKAGPITKKEDDLELLQLYVDLEFDDLPFAARIEILDRILELDDDRENLLQYRGAKPCRASRDMWAPWPSAGPEIPTLGSLAMPRSSGSSARCRTISVRCRDRGGRSKDGRPQQ